MTTSTHPAAVPPSSTPAQVDAAIADHWRAELRDAGRPLDFPVDGPRDGRRSGGPLVRRPFVLPPEVLRGGADFAAGPEGAVTFLACALGILLDRSCEQEAVVVGVGLARSRECLPVRVPLRAKESFRLHLDGVARAITEGAAHGGPPRRELALAFGLDPARLFRVAVTSDAGPPLPPGLDLGVCLRQDGAEGFVENDSFVLAPEVVDRLMGHLSTLAGAASRDPEQPAGALPLLTPAETQRTLIEWNETAEALPGAPLLHAQFEAHVARQPDAPAIMTGDRVLTYAQLDERANRVARHLRTLGVGRDELVGVCLHRSVDAVAAILGVLKAGGAYVPMDPAYPRDRLAFMLEDTKVRWLVTLRAELAQLPPLTPTLPVLLDELALEGDASAAVTPAAEVQPDDLCYVMYTSGSTGRPKGILLQHGGVANNIADLNHRFRVGPGDRLLAVSSLSFDMSVYDLLGTLGAGATIVLPDLAKLRDPAYLADLVRGKGVTIWNSTPALLKLVVDALAGEADERLRSIRLVLFGGDWIPVSLPDRVRVFAPGAILVALGGATEASIHSTIHLIEGVDPAWTSIPYGKPMANQKVYVLDAALQPVPVGVPGELFLGGVGVARGYLKRPELTAERFLDSPFVSGERIYRTGDRVRFFPDGNLELLGRMDFQVKIRGFRVELGEIATVFEQSPGVQEAVAIVREDSPGDRRVVVYVVPSVQGMDHTKLLAAAAKLLPDYMVPSAVVSLAALPLSANGKVDRKALPAPALEARRASVRAPRSAAERLLVECWQDILNVRPIGIDDNFFSLGGDSIQCMKMATRARRAGLRVAPNDVFLKPTIAALADGLAPEAARERPAQETRVHGRPGVGSAELAKLLSKASG